MPCTEKRARQLLQRGRAVVHRRVPFVIRLKDRLRENSAVQPIVLKIDPGAQTTGLAVVREEDTDDHPVHHALHLAELAHRGFVVRALMVRRAQARRRRRNANLRHRPARFLNRVRSKDWLPPSLHSRVATTVSWARRYGRWFPLTRVDVERVRFGTQKLRNPEIQGVQYQQGTLFGYEVRAYVLAKWQRRCAYCGATDVALQVEHIHPRARGGTDRVDNLCLACAPCNRQKGTMTAAEYGFPHIEAQARMPLQAAAAVNATRYALCDRLAHLGTPVTTWTGGRTLWNRIRLGVRKTHALDALCIGTVSNVVGTDVPILRIRATGRGTRCRTNWDTYGFPRGHKLRHKRVGNMATGDIVQAVVPTGKHAGVHVGRIVVRASGSCCVEENDGINIRYCRVLQRADGYAYALSEGRAVAQAERGSTP